MLLHGEQGKRHPELPVGGGPMWQRAETDTADELAAEVQNLAAPCLHKMTGECPANTLGHFLRVELG